MGQQRTIPPALDVFFLAQHVKGGRDLFACVESPNLPRVYDFFGEGGCWYLIMDFIAGETLEAYLYRMGGRLPLEQVLQIGIRLCSVLEFLLSGSAFAGIMTSLLWVLGSMPQ